MSKVLGIEKNILGNKREKLRLGVEWADCNKVRRESGSLRDDLLWPRDVVTS